jgi:predicted adenylyl cyclase CyaB
MPRNIEIKARIASVEVLDARVRVIATAGPTLIDQDDTFFTCTRGRLKLRMFSADRGELIYYQRSDQAGPKTSHYLRTPTTEPDALRETLTQALGQAGRVTKQRVLYLVGRTRVHLDRVDSLGDFLELEVVLRDDEPADAGVAEAHALTAGLGIEATQLVDVAYVDLLAGLPTPR